MQRLKILVAIVVTILVMLQLFYYVMCTATTYFGYTTDGRQIVAVDTLFGTYNYWDEVK